MSYEFKTEKFTGPLEKLLELIEAEKLDVNEVNLAAVTDGFLRYLENMQKDLVAEEENGREPVVLLRLIADFIVVASRLILIKSKTLLPELNLTEEEEGDIKDLEARLRLYREIKNAGKSIQEKWQSSGKEFSRPYLWGAGAAGHAYRQAGFFYPGEKLTLQAVFRAMESMLKGLESLQPETKTIKEKIISLEQKIKEVLRRLGEIKEISFEKLSGTTKSELVVAFLAILHLAREQVIFLEQAGRFSDIIIKKSNRE